jgi:hypothetical protein
LHRCNSRFGKPFGFTDRETYEKSKMLQEFNLPWTASFPIGSGFGFCRIAAVGAGEFD